MAYSPHFGLEDCKHAFITSFSHASLSSQDLLSLWDDTTGFLHLFHQGELTSLPPQDLLATSAQPGLAPSIHLCCVCSRQLDRPIKREPSSLKHNDGPSSSPFLSQGTRIGGSGLSKKITPEASVTSFSSLISRFHIGIFN